MKRPVELVGPRDAVGTTTSVPPELDASFLVEVRSCREEPSLPDAMDVLVAWVPKRRCHALLQELADCLPLGGRTTNTSTSTTTQTSETGGSRSSMTTHLKRIRNRTKMELRPEYNGNGDSTVAVGTPDEVEVILGTPEDLREMESSEEGKATLRRLASEYGWNQHERPFQRTSVPGRPARSKDERTRWNRGWWPTVAYSDDPSSRTSTSTSPSTSLRASDAELAMAAALQDARATAADCGSSSNANGNADANGNATIVGAVVFCPQSRRIVSRSYDERQQQQQQQQSQRKVTNKTNTNTKTNTNELYNPLATSVLLAVQGVSRIERAKATKGQEPKEEQDPSTTGVPVPYQYLCTGYDVYVTREPSVYEAMCLLHSRIRHVVFAVPDEREGGLGGQSSSHPERNLERLWTRNAHTPTNGGGGGSGSGGINHRYGVYRLNEANPKARAIIEDYRRLAQSCADTTTTQTNPDVKDENDHDTQPKKKKVCIS